ncbi:MAG: pantoate--beta-alanine ligase, partial [Candidatus Binatia bacterium]
AYLTLEGRRAALCLFRSLRRAAWLVEKGVTQARTITEAVRAEIEAEPLARVEYVTLCDAVSLEGINELYDRALLALAVHIGQTRLIDNTILKR